MGLIGLKFSNRTTHPQELIDALYEEIFDHHDEESEIDVVVALKTESRDDGRPEEMEVIDFVVGRVEDEFLLTDRDDPIENLRATIEWAANVIDTTEADCFVFMHKHEPDFPTPGAKDVNTASILTAMDFALNRETRMFVLMAVINKDRSTPMSPDEHVRASGDLETDSLVTVRMGELALSTERDHQPADEVAEFEACLESMRQTAIEMRDARLAYASDDVIREIMERAQPIVQRSAEIAMGWAPPGMRARLMDIASQQAVERIFPIDDMPPEVRKLLEDLITGHMDGMLQIRGDDDESSLGFEPPQIQMLPELPAAGEPGESRPKPSDIFDLPGLDPTDPEIHWDN